MANLAIRGGSPVRETPFPVWPVWGDEEIDYLTRVIKSGKWGSINGKVTAEFEARFAAYQQAKHGICVNSGTTALRIACTAADIDVGDEVLVPAYTFIATASAVVEAGAVPIFVDIDPTSYNIDLKDAEKKITAKTKGIMPVHFAGRPVDMDAVISFAENHKLVVIEDAAQAWGAEWGGRRVGAIGDAGCFSFQSSKNINAGEGGIITTNDDLIAKMARSHANCGRSADGLWYEHFYFGGNSRMTEFQSAVLTAQLERYDELKSIRQQNLTYLESRFQEIVGVQTLQKNDRITGHAAHLFIFRYLKDRFGGKSKAAFIEAMRKEGIPVSPGYSLPLYKQPVFINKAFGPRGRSVNLPVDYGAVVCPQTEKACYEEAVWLTQNVLLGTREDMDTIVRAVEKVREFSDELA